MKPNRTTKWTAWIGLCVCMAASPLLAQVGTPILVNGGNYVPTSGTTITTTADYTRAVIVQSSGTLLGAEGWNLSTAGINSYGVFVTNNSIFSGTNLNIHTTGSNASGFSASSSGTLIASGVNISTSGAGASALSIAASSFIGLTGGTLTTTQTSAAGVAVNGGGATLSNVTMNVAGDLVNTANGTVTLDNVHGTNGANVFNAISGNNTLNIQNSVLSGNLTNNGGALGIVNLVSGSLTGAANNLPGTLNVSVDSASQWIVNASSTLNGLTNQGVVDMSTAGELRNLNVASFTQAASGSIAMTLSGSGGAVNELVTASGALTLAGALVLNGDAGAVFSATSPDGYFVLFNKTSTGALTGGFTDIQLNGMDYGFIADGGTFTDGVYTYTLSYHGDAATGALTGGNDVLLHVIPEPSAWAMSVGGLGLLFCGQRLRQRSRG